MSEIANPPPRFVDIDEAKRQLCLGTTAIYELLKTGELRRVKIGRKTVLLQQDLWDFMRRKVAEASGAAR
jgi:predicted DNA-binding transcriptional regulator AlpA